MKKISFEIEAAARSKEALQQLIGPAPEGGYSIDQVRAGIKVLDKIASSPEEVIELEDAEYEFVMQRLRAAKWLSADPFVVSFYDAITGAS